MKKTLKIEVLKAEQAKGSWKAIALQSQHILGRPAMKHWDEDNKMGLMVSQEALSLIQPDFERGIHPTDPKFNRFANHVKIHKGDWLVLTTFGSLILTPAEYEEFVR